MPKPMEIADSAKELAAAAGLAPCQASGRGCGELGFSNAEGIGGKAGTNPLFTVILCLEVSLIVFAYLQYLTVYIFARLIKFQLNEEETQKHYKDEVMGRIKTQRNKEMADTCRERSVGHV